MEIHTSVFFFFTKFCSVARISTNRAVGIALMIYRAFDMLIYGDVFVWIS